MSEAKETKRVIICGGGLVGALNACFMAKRGFQVDLYEKAQDVRTQHGEQGRSINLTLAHRGREALKAVNLDQRIMATGIPVHGRMVHCKDGTLTPMSYGKPGQSIISLNRKRLNEEILTAAEEYSNVRTHFNHKLVSCDIDAGEVTFLHEGREVKRTADVIIGNDGAYSSVRGQMMKHPEVNLDFQQEYIPHCYMQIDIPPTADGEFALEENYIHVWPRENLLLVALSNPDKSFTAALFMYCQLFQTIRQRDAIVPFFAEHLPDALALIGEDNLRKTFMDNKPSRLISIKCYPHHFSNKAVIMGDAAHAMTPFYGQGMNCGFEDCLVLSELLDEYKDDFGKALPAYTENRHKDTKAMVDLAMHNYDVLRSSVNSPVFRLRKKVDRALHSWFPSAWTDLYIAVAFSRKKYQECVDVSNMQDKIVTVTCILLLMSLVFCTLFPVCAYCM